jgi:rRNA processing protein Krr1/Pno1
MQKGFCSITHPNTNAEEIVVPTRLHGRIIGPGGSCIKMIQDKTNTRVNMPGKGQGDVVTIVGDMADVLKARHAIQQLMDQGYSSLTHEDWTKIEVPFPADRLSDLIGSGGSNIREISKTTGCRISTPSDNDPVQGFITILGAADAVLIAKEMVLEKAVPEEIPIDPAWRAASDGGFDLEQLNQW